MPQIRVETPADHAAIREVNRLAFGRDEEADLVDRLREDGVVVASLVATAESGVVGHILFTRVYIETPQGARPAVSLAPMAVHPGKQREGIGTALVRRGLEVCRQQGERIVVVVGHPDYYPRFGFFPALAKALDAPWSGDAWMALELVPGALEGVHGVMRYPAAFDSLE